MSTAPHNPFAAPTVVEPIAVATSFTPDAELSVEYQLTEEDYVLWHLFVQGDSAALRRHRKRVFLTLVALMSGLAWVLWGGINDPPLRILMVGGCGLIVVMLLYRVWKPQSKDMKKLLLRMLAEEQSRTAYLPARMTIRESGIETANSLASGHLNWRCVTSVMETEPHLVLRLSKMTALLIPKAAFPTGEYYHRFLATARAYQSRANP